MILLYAQRLPFCEAIWPALPWSAMARSENRLEQLTKSLGIENAVLFLRLAQPCGSPQAPAIC